MTEFDITIIHDPLGTPTDITDDFEQIEMTEIGTGETTSMKLRLNNIFGKFVQAGQGPVIDEYDKIKVTLRDQEFTSSPDHEIVRIYEVITIMPIENSTEGNIMELECAGLEHHLQRIHFAKQYFFETAFFVTRDIGDIYNENRGTLNPELEDHDSNTSSGGGNDLPIFTSNDYDFNISETFCYTGLDDVVNRLGNSVAGEGANDFFELFFVRGSADDKIAFRAFSSGVNPGAGNELTISDADVDNEDPSEAGLESTTGTLLGAWGADALGSLPPEFSVFASQVIAFELAAIHILNEAYPADAKVRVGTAIFRTPIATVSNPPAAPWTQIEVRDILGPTAQYSPWTDTLNNEWINSGANPDPTVHGTQENFNERACWDSNLVVIDAEKFRSWADVRSTTDNFDVNYKYGMVSGGSYRGLRALVDGTGTGLFSAFTDALVEFDGFSWQLKHQFIEGTAPDIFGIADTAEVCAVISEEKNYEFKIGKIWTDVSGENLKNDCFHQYTGISNDAGYVSTIKSVGPVTTYGDTSAISVQYVWTPIVGVLGTVVAGDTPNYYKAGCWLNFRLPFPHSTHNGVSQIGTFYGNNLVTKEPATLDINNMHLTHSGFRGFNNVEAEDLGPLSHVNFNARFFWTHTSTGAIVAEGDFKFRCILYDTEDDVLVADFTIPINNIWHPVSLPITSFKIYRGRNPLGFGQIGQTLVVTELDVTQRFRYRNFKQVCIQWQESYDSEGRYDGAGSRANTVTFFTNGGSALLFIDGFHFGKPMMTTTAVTQGVVTGRVLEPPFQQLPFISNMIQLRQANDSQLEIENFRHKQYDIRTDGIINIDYGESFFLQKDFLVSENDPDTDGNPAINNIKLVAKKIIYKVTKPHNSPGKFERIITGVKRFI